MTSPLWSQKGANGHFVLARSLVFLHKYWIRLLIHSNVLFSSWPLELAIYDFYMCTKCGTCIFFCWFSIAPNAKCFFLLQIIALHLIDLPLNNFLPYNSMIDKLYSYIWTLRTWFHQFDLCKSQLHDSCEKPRKEFDYLIHYTISWEYSIVYRRNYWIYMVNALL